MKQITIIGAGFSALSAACKLRQLNAASEITLIAPKAEMALPPLGLMHNAKAFFESWYLRKYR